MLTSLKYVFTIGIVLLPYLCFSQNGFSTGYVINSKGDTISCLVAKVTSGNTPEFVDYKLTETSEVIRISVHGSKGFKEEFDKFERHQVKLSMSKISVNELSVGIDTTFTEKLVFLKLIEEGKNINLYVYNDKIKRRFFIKERGDTELKELLSFTYYEDESKTKIRNTQSFRRQWYDVFSRYGLESKGNRALGASFTQDDMIRLASLVNGEESKKGRDKHHIAYFGGLGFNTYKAYYKGQHELAEDSENSQGSSPYFFIGADLVFNPRVGKSIIRAELSYYRLKNEIIRKDIHHGPYDLKHLLELSNLGASVQFLYKLYKSNSVDVYTGTGVLFQYTFNKRNVLEYHYPHVSYEGGDPTQIRNITMFLPFTAGVSIKKLDVNMSYLSARISEYYQLHSIRLNRLKIGLSYRFN